MPPPTDNLDGPPVMTMPKIVVVPRSAFVVRRPETPGLPSTSSCPAFTRPSLEKRGAFVSARPTSPNTSKSNIPGANFAHRLFRRLSQNHRTDEPDRVDGIFSIHATNEHHELRRRKTEENVRRRAKIEDPLSSMPPPAPRDTMLMRYKERQADWKRRSMLLRSKTVNSSHGKRWSLKTWRAESGREHERSPKLPDLSNGVASAEPSSRPKKKRSMSLHSRRWSFRQAPEKLQVIREQESRVQSPAFNYDRYSASEVHLPRTQRLTPPALAARKATSMKTLRPEVSYDHRIAHLLQGPRHPNDQRHIHPALRSPVSNNSSPYLSTIAELPANEGVIRPTPRLVPRVRITPPSTVLQTLDLATLQAKHEITSSKPPTIQQKSIAELPANEEVIRPTPPPAPRVRIIPPSTMLQTPDLPTTHTQPAILTSKPPTIQEKTALVRSRNTTRAALSTAPLDLHPLLSNHAQDYVALHLPPIPPPKPLPQRYERRMSRERHPRACSTQIESIEFASLGRANAVRLMSPPGLGALACGELWASGKYKRHKTARQGQEPAEHRFTLLPGFEMRRWDGVFFQGEVGSPQHASAKWCPCAEFDAWRAVTDGRWKCVGVGQAQDGRWAVELWEPDES